MDKQQPQSRAPLIIAAILLLLPVLYVGSYLALVTPGDLTAEPFTNPNFPHFVDITSDYRYQRRWCAKLFWPLEQIDRKMRPAAWRAWELNHVERESLVP